MRGMQLAAERMGLSSLLRLGARTSGMAEGVGMHFNPTELYERLVFRLWQCLLSLLRFFYRAICGAQDGKREPKMKLPRPNVASRAVVQPGTSTTTAESPAHGSPFAPPSEERVSSHVVAPVLRKAPALKMVGQPSPITADGPPGPTHWVLRLKSKEEFQAALSKYQHALESLQQMGSDTESAQLVRLTVMLKMAQCQNVLGMHAECIHICTELLELTPDDYTEFIAAACCIRGAAYYTRGGTVELALADLQRADALCPDDPTICAVYNKLPKLLRIHGDELMAAGMFEEAADKFSRAVAGLDANAVNSPSTAATSLKEYCQVKKAECLYNLGEHDACVATCTALLVDGGTGSNYIAAATYIRGVEYYAIGELDLAAEDLAEAHRLSPDHVTIHQAYKKVMARIETTRRPAALTAPPLVAPVPTSPVAEGTPTNLGMSAVLPTAPQTEVTLDWDTAQAAGEYRDAMEGFLQALTAVQANGVAPQDVKVRLRMRAKDEEVAYAEADAAAPSEEVAYAEADAAAPSEEVADDEVSADDYVARAQQTLLDVDGTRVHRWPTAATRTEDTPLTPPSALRSSGRSSRSHSPGRASVRFADAAPPPEEEEEEEEAHEAHEVEEAEQEGREQQVKKKAEHVKPVAAHAPLVRSTMATSSDTTIVTVGPMWADTRLAPKRHTSYRDVGLHALDAVQILRRVHKEALPEECVLQLPQHLQSAVQEVHQCKLEVSVECMRKVHALVEGLAARATHSSVRNGLRAPPAMVDLLLVDPYESGERDRGFSVYMAGIQYAVKHLSAKGVGVLLVSPDDLQEDVSITHTLARTVKEAGFYVHRCPMRWARSNPKSVSGMTEPAEVEYPMLVFAWQPQHNYFPTMQVVEKRFSNVLWVPIGVDDMLCKAGAAAAAVVRLRPSSQKPVALMRELLRVYTLPGALVLELACGTVRHRPLPQYWGSQYVAPLSTSCALSGAEGALSGGGSDMSQAPLAAAGAAEGRHVLSLEGDAASVESARDRLNAMRETVQAALLRPEPAPALRGVAANHEESATVADVAVPTVDDAVSNPSFSERKGGFTPLNW